MTSLDKRGAIAQPTQGQKGNQAKALPMKADPFQPTLCFKVESISERFVSGVRVFDTLLRDYVSYRTLTIRGKPWPLGAKVDFVVSQYWPIGKDDPICKKR